MFEIFTYISFQKNPVGSEMFNIKPFESLLSQLISAQIPLYIKTAILEFGPPGNSLECWLCSDHSNPNSEEPLCYQHM